MAKKLQKMFNMTKYLGSANQTTMICHHAFIIIATLTKIENASVGNIMEELELLCPMVSMKNGKATKDINMEVLQKIKRLL